MELSLEKAKKLKGRLDKYSGNTYIEGELPIWKFLIVPSNPEHLSDFIKRLHNYPFDEDDAIAYFLDGPVSIVTLFWTGNPGDFMHDWIENTIDRYNWQNELIDL